MCLADIASKNIKIQTQDMSLVLRYCIELLCIIMLNSGILVYWRYVVLV